MALTRCTLTTFLVSCILLQLTLPAVVPASSSEIFASPLESLQGLESAVTGIAEAKRRNLKGGGARGGIGGRGFGGRGIGYRKGGTGALGSTIFGSHHHARSAAVSLEHRLGMTISAVVSVSSMIILVFLV